MAGKNVFFVDVDYTLASFEPSAGNAAVSGQLSDLVPQKHEEASSLFGSMFSAMLDFQRGKKSGLYSEFMDFVGSAVVSYPSNLKPDLMFSRELHLKFVSEKLGLQLSGSQIIGIIDSCWNAIISATRIYPDSFRFLSRVRDPFIIAGGDGRLMFSNSSFVYNPVYSRAKRLERTNAIGLGKYFEDGKILIGDPVKKGSSEFWDLCIDAAKLDSVSQGIVVDDSLSVVKSAMNRGFKGILMDRNGVYGSAVSAVDLVVSSFDDLR